MGIQIMPGGDWAVDIFKLKGITVLRGRFFEEVAWIVDDLSGVDCCYVLCVVMDLNGRLRTSEEPMKRSG